MKKEIVRLVASAYLKIRKIFERRVFEVLTKEYVEDKNFKEYFKLDIEEFSDKINSYEYKPDLVRGLLDSSFPEDKPEYFFSEVTYGRDCDDWSRVWKIYLELNDWKEVTEVCVLSKDNPFKTAHFITVAKKDEFYYCFNYVYTGKKHCTFEKAVKEVTGWNIYDEDNLVYIKY